jgi:hypothetical protein
MRWPLCKDVHACLIRANLGLLRESSQCQHARLSEICCLNVSQRKLDLGDACFRFETVLHAFNYTARERDSNITCNTVFFCSLDRAFFNYEENNQQIH